MSSTQTIIMSLDKCLNDRSISWLNLSETHCHSMIRIVNTGAAPEHSTLLNINAIANVSRHFIIFAVCLDTRYALQWDRYQSRCNVILEQMQFNERKSICKSENMSYKKNTSHNMHTVMKIFAIVFQENTHIFLNICPIFYFGFISWFEWLKLVLVLGCVRRLGGFW